MWTVRGSVGVLTVFVGLVIVLGIGAPAAAEWPLASGPRYVKYDQRGLFLWGNLTWQGGKGRIVWGPATATDEVGGGGTTPNEALMGQDWNAHYYAGVDPMPPPEPDVFESDPLPLRVYVNVSQSILVDLQLQIPPSGSKLCQSSYQAYSEPELDLELRHGDRLVGGAVGYDYIYWYYANPGTGAKPTDPDGFSTCRFALSPEVSILEPGASVQLSVIHVRQSKIYPYGFGAVHPSVIRIPLYPPEEIFLRYPDAPETRAQAEAEEDETADEPAVVAQASASLVGLAALGLAVPTRGRRGALLAALLLVATAASGCLLSKSKAAPTTSELLRGRGDVTQVRDGLGLADEGRGSIIGRVRDDLHIPVGGVHVSIIGFPNFTTTDGQGLFKFRNLVPGLYKLRFDKITYNSFELDAEVKSGFVTKPDVVLVLTDAKDREARPHNHDYWPPNTVRKDLMNAPLVTTCASALPACLPQNPFAVAAKTDENNIIIPGTSTVEVTLTFEREDLGTELLGLAVRHNAERWANYSVYAPRPSGVPFKIATSSEMTDHGHQPYSSWQFYWVIPHRAASSYAEYWVYFYSPPSQPPSVSAKISIQRGTALPLEPGHPDVWGDKTQLDVAKGQAVTYTWSTVPPGPGFAATSGKYSCAPYLGGYLTKRIEPGTNWIEVTLKQDRRASPHFEWVMHYKPSNVPSTQASYQTWNGYTEAKRTKDFDGSKTVWRVPVKELEADYLYGKAATWFVMFEPANYDAWWQDGLVGYVGNSGRSVGLAGYLSLTCDIVAHRTPMP